MGRVEKPLKCIIGLMNVRGWGKQKWEKKRDILFREKLKALKEGVRWRGRAKKRVVSAISYRIIWTVFNFIKRLLQMKWELMIHDFIMPSLSYFVFLFPRFSSSFFFFLFFTVSPSLLPSSSFVYFTIFHLFLFNYIPLCVTLSYLLSFFSFITFLLPIN